MNNTEIAIRVENLSKRYRIGLEEEMHDTMAGALVDFIKRPLQNLRRLRGLTQFSENGHEPDDVIWALKDVSFEVKRGEVVGIIGRNGAGKSTLLKILSRITHPTNGRIELNGRISSLLEVGTGFHPELTGRENIYLNGTILGMRKAEIDRKFDEIVDFSGVEKFIDTPVKRYSSGMRVRLAFSVAAHLEPEILLVDEVLAVGDVEFQKKCLGKMEQVGRGGRTVLFVSHNMMMIRNLCSRSILLEGGQMKLDGESEAIIEHYLRLNQSNQEHDRALITAQNPGYESRGEIKFTQWTVKDDIYGSGLRVGSMHGCEFHISYKAVSELRNVSVTLTIESPDGTPLLSGVSKIINEDFNVIPSHGAFVCRFDQMPLVPGEYIVNLWCSVNERTAARVTNAGRFSVTPEDVFGTGRSLKKNHGYFPLHHSWKLVERLGEVNRDV